MKILVTGATGFVGGHLTAALRKQGHTVRALVRTATDSQPLAAAGGEVMHGDVRDADVVRRACRGMDAVCHTAAMVAPWGRFESFHAVNVIGTQNVLDACRTESVHRLVFISSSSVIFDGRDQRDVGEDTPYPHRFLSHYASTKKLAEEVVRAASDTETVVLRPCSIFGPGDRTLAPRLLEASRRGELMQIGRGDNVVDLVYIDNVTSAIQSALQTRKGVGKVYAITNGEPVRIWELIPTLLRRMGINDRLRRIPLPVALGLASIMERHATVTNREPLLTRFTAATLARTQICSIRAARRDLEYTPNISIDEGLNRTLTDLQAQIGPDATGPRHSL
jgi:nucleoside-diphosphate-sugar epimerase